MSQFLQARHGAVVTSITFIMVLFLVLYSAALQNVFAQAVAPEPSDASTSICDELSSSDPQYPSYCSDRDSNNAKSNGGSASSDSSSPILGPNSVLYRVIQLVTTLTGVLSVVMIIVGGFRYVVSGGDSSATKGAKDTILYAVVGLVIAIFAQTIITFVLSRL